MTNNGPLKTLYSWPMDKNVEDFKAESVVGDTDTLLMTASNMGFYLIERVKLAEIKQKQWEGAVDCFRKESERLQSALDNLSQQHASLLKDYEQMGEALERALARIKELGG